MVDKYKTCKDCPDRSISPNCHTLCEGYLYRVKRNKEIAEKKRIDAIMKGYEFDKNSKLHTQRMKDSQRQRNRKR